jgi:transposase
MSGKKTVDVRSLDEAQRNDLIQQALGLRENTTGGQNLSIQQVANQIGVHRATVTRWFKNQLMYGSPASLGKGRKKGSNSFLTRAQSDWVIGTLLSAAPTLAGKRGGLWNKSRIEHLILREFDIDVPPDYVPRLLRRYDFPRQHRLLTTDDCQYRDLLTGQIVDAASWLSENSPGDSRKRFQVNRATLDPQLLQKVLFRLDQPDHRIQEALSRPHELLCAHNPKGTMSFRAFPAPISPTAISEFTRLIKTEASSPVVIVFHEPCELTQGGKKWLEKQGDQVKAICIMARPSQPDEPET